MHGTQHNDAQRRRLNGDKIFFTLPLNHRTFIQPEGLYEFHMQGVAVHIRKRQETLRAVLEACDQRARLTFGAGLVEAGQIIGFHDKTFST